MSELWRTSPPAAGSQPMWMSSSPVASPQPAPPADVAPPPMLTSAMDPNPVLRAILGVEAPTPTMPMDPLAADTRSLRGRNAGPPVRTQPMGMPPMGAELPPDLSTAGGDFEAGQLMLGMVPGGVNMLAGANKATLDTTIPQPDQNPLVGGPGLMPPDVAANVPGDADFARMRGAMADEGVRQLLDALPGVITRTEQAGQIPVNPYAQDIMDADSIAAGLEAAARGLGNDPLGVMRTFILRSLPASAPGIAGAVVGSAAGPLGAAAGAGAGEFLTEGGLSAADGVMQALREAGVDPTDRAAVEAFVRRNPDTVRQVAIDAMQRAGIISATGAVSGGVSGMAARNIARGGRTGRQLAGDAVAGLGIEPVMEGAGEALAGGSPGDVIAEALGGAGQGAVQLGGQTIVEAVRQALSAPAQPQSGSPAPVAAPGAPDAPARPVTALEPLPPPARPVQPQVEVEAPVRPRATAEEFQALMAASRAKTAERNAQADALSADEKPVRMAGEGASRALVSKDLEEAGKWRVTAFDEKGPIGHTVHNNKRDAIYDALQRGYAPAQPAPQAPAQPDMGNPITPAEPDIGNPISAPPPVERALGRTPTPEEEAEAVRIEREAAKIPKAQVTSWVARLPSDRRAASSAARPATGIDPDGEVGRELKLNGVTPQRFPKLFQRGGRRDLDNIPHEQLPPELQQIVARDETTGYVDRQDLIDAIIAESNNSPRLTSEQSSLRAQAQAVARRYEADYGQTTLPDEPAPSGVGRYVVSDPNMDLSTPEQRMDEAARVVDDLLANEYPGFQMTPQDRLGLITGLWSRGGDADAAFNWWLIQNAEYADGSPQEAYSDIPFDIGDAPVRSGEDQGGGGGRAGEARPQPGADQAGPDGAGGAGRAEPGGGLQGPDDARPGPGAARTGTAEGGDGLDPNITRRITEVGMPAANASDKDKVAWQIAVGLIRNRDGNLEHYFNGWNPLTPEQAKFLSDNGLTVPQQAAAPARSGTAEGGRVDLTREGQQLVIPGAEQITDRQRAERQQDQPMRGGDAPPAEGGLFSPKGPELFDERAEPSNAPRGPGKIRAYHGSPTDFEEFDIALSNPRDPDLPVRAIWFSANQDEATRSGKFPYGRPNSPQVFVKEVFLRPQKIASRDDVMAISSAMKNEGLPPFNSDEITKRLLDAGFDAIQLGKGEDARYAVINPDIIDYARPAKPSKTVTLDDAAKPKKPKTTGKQPKGSLTPSFLSMSFTDKNSVFEAAFRAAGIEPDKARLMSASRQIAVLRKVLQDTYGITVELPERTVVRKTISGRSVEERRPKISDRDAIDQMLDAFRQMQMMAHILTLPEGAVGLRDADGKSLVLSLVNRLKGALGSYGYDPEGGSRRITLPGRSNSFGHEWGHALDHFIHTLVKPGDWSGLLSQSIAKDGVQDGTRQNRIAQAFVGVLQAMYGKRAALGALQINVMVQAAQVNPKTGLPTKKAQKAQKYLEMIEAGQKLPPEAWSDYFATSKAFDDAWGGGGYFTSPAEMFARVFEAYLGTRAAALSGEPTSFLAKPDWAYNESDETRAKMTFPRGVDQIAVFTALENLMNEIREFGVFGPGRAAQPSDADIYDRKQLDKMPPAKSLIEQEREARRAHVRARSQIERTHPLGKQALDTVSFFTDTFGGFLHGLINRQPKAAQTALRNMVDLFVTDPGSGRLVKQVWEEAQQEVATRWLNRLDNLSKKHDLDGFTDDEVTALRQAMTGGKGKPSAKVEAAAADLRRVMDDIWRYLTEAGVKIGYAKNGYLPRIMDRDAVMSDQGKFRAQAKKVYRVMFDRDVRQADFEDQITDIRKLLRTLTGDTEGTETGDRAAVLRLTDSDKALVAEWKKALRTYERLQKQAADLAKKGDEDKADALSEKIAEAREALDDVHERMIDMLDDRWSDYAADHWLVGVLAKSAMDFDHSAPQSGFTKKRVLPPEADALMADFYQGNPATLVKDFISIAARRAEWVKRVGESGEKLNNMVEAAIKAGADSRDVEEIRHSINVLAGRVSANGESFLSTTYGWFYTFGTMFLLKLAPLASLAEPMVAGLKTGRVRDQIRGMALMLSQMRRTGSAQDRRELARVIGLTRSAMNETILQNRYGGDLDPSQRQARWLSNFFTRTGLTGLTSASRHAMLPIAADHIRRMLLIDAGRRSSFFEVNKRLANEELNDLGIPSEHREALLDWLDSMDGRLPKAEDLIGTDGDYFNPAAAIWGPAMMRFVDNTIQNTRRFDRPGAAARPGTSIIYGITGFIFAFHRNVLGRMLKQGVDARRDGESSARATVRQGAGAAMNVARYAPAIGMLIAGHTLTSIFRDYVFAQEGWEDAEDEDELVEWLLKRAWSRTGLMGAWDIPYNLISGLRYDRDLAAAGVGPHIGLPFGVAQRMANIWFGRNSDNTNTTENRGVDALASYVMTGFGNMALSAMPGGPLTGAATGTAMYAWSLFDPGKQFADALFPLDD